MLLSSPEHEARLFGALVCEPGVLEACDDLETDDFWDLHLKFAFLALRNLQAGGKRIDAATIEAELLRLGYENVVADIGRVWATFDLHGYHSLALVRDDVRWLKRLTRRRAAL